MRKHLFGLEKKPHRTLVFDNHTPRLGATVLHKKPVQDSFEVQEKMIFSAPRMKGQATSVIKGEGQREEAEAGWRGKGEPQRARLTPPTNKMRDTDPSCKAGGSCLSGFPRLWHRQNRQRGFATLSFCSPSPLPAFSML